MGMGNSGELAIRLHHASKAWRDNGYVENAALLDEAVAHLKDMEAAFNATCAYELGYEDGKKAADAQFSDCPHCYGTGHHNKLND